MGVSDAARADLFTALVEVLGETRAETMMSLSHEHDYNQLATKADLQILKSELKSELMSELAAELGGEIRALGDSLNARMDRLFYLMVVVMVAVLAAMTSLYLS